MNNEILVSIIIPVYNREKDIEKLLKTLKTQDDEECELVIIDDGSTDQTFNICNKIKNEFRMNVSVKKKKNGGASSARNEALEIAKGKYICFIDSDDSIEGNYIKCVKDLCSKGYDIYQLNYQIGNNNGYTKICNDLPNGSMDLKKYYGFILEQKSNPPWNKIYLSKIIQENNIKFDTELTVAEDINFTLFFLEFCHNCYISDAAVYKYFINPDGLNLDVKIEYLENNDKLYKNMKHFIKNKDLPEDYYYTASIYMMRSFFRDVGFLILKGEARKNIVGALKKCDSYNEIIRLNIYKKTDRVRQFLLKRELYWIISMIMKMKK